MFAWLIPLSVLSLGKRWTQAADIWICLLWLSLTAADRQNSSPSFLLFEQKIPGGMGERSTRSASCVMYLRLGWSKSPGGGSPGGGRQGVYIYHVGVGVGGWFFAS